MAVYEGPREGSGSDGFIELLDHLCGDLMSKLPARPFENVVDQLSQWGMEEQLRTNVEVGATNTTQHILARGVEDLTLQRKRVIVHVNLSMTFGDDGKPVHLGVLKPVQRTLSSLVVQCPVVLLVHLEDLARPGARPPSVEPLLPALKTMSGGNNVRFFATPDYHKITGIGVGDMAVVENLLRFPEELRGDRAFAISLSRMGDIYVNEAFASLHLGHASTRYLPFLVEQYGLGYSCAEYVSSLHTTTSNPALPHVVCFGGMAPLTGRRAAALSETVYTADEILLVGRPGLVFLHCTAGVPLDVLPVVDKSVGGGANEAFTEEEVRAMRAAMDLAARLKRTLRGPVDHTILAVRGKKQRRQVSVSPPPPAGATSPRSPPRAGESPTSARFRMEVRRYERLEVLPGHPFPIPPKTEYFGVGPETVALVAKAIAGAETSLVIDTLGVVRHHASRDPTDPGALKLTNLDACPTRALLTELADAQAVQQRRAKFVGWTLLDVVEMSAVAQKIRGVVPGMDAALTLLLS